MTSYREGVPVNHHVTKYSHDSLMGLPPHYDVILGGYLSIIMLLFIAMTHAGCGLKLCRVTKNRDDKLCSPLSKTLVDGEVKLKMYEKCIGKICNLNFAR